MSHMGVASDLSLGRPSSIMGRPLFPSNPLARLSESSNISLHTRLDLAQLESYVRALEDEREKIDAFRRELPICMRLLDDAIEASRLKLTSTALTGSITSHASYSSCFNKATLPSEVPMWKANWEKQEADISDAHEDKVEASLSGWNKPLELNDQYTQEQGNITWNRANILQRGISPARCVQLELMKQIKADSFNESNSDYLHGMDAQPVIDHASPTSAGAAGVRTSTALGQQPRKARRCWSPELHQRFLHALHQLGGPQLATPKQIREVMGVEGLTNDEVKSHLQKFRLHTRRPVTLQASHEPAQQPHQLVVFGGIWVPTSPAEPQPAQVAGASTCNQDQPMRSLCHAAAAGGGHHARSVSDHHHNTYMHAQFQHTRPNVIGQTPMQTMLNATFSDQLEIQAGMEAASVEDLARSDQSTSLNGEAAGLDNQHEEEDTEIHLGSKRLSREINSPLNAKARY